MGYKRGNEKKYADLLLYEGSGQDRDEVEEKTECFRL